MNEWWQFQNTPPQPALGTCSSEGGEVIACQISYGWSGCGTSVSCSTNPPRSGIPGGGKSNTSPWYENESLSSASRTTSIASSNILRLSSSAATWSGLSKLPILVPSGSASRGTVPRPTPRMPRPPDRLWSVAKSSASLSGCHCGTMLNAIPIRIRSVRSARTEPISRPFGITS